MSDTQPEHCIISERLVIIEWEDSHSDGSWQELGEELEDRALLCRSVGWLVMDGERAKVIVPHMSKQDAGVPPQGCGVMTIPASSVLRIIDLQPIPNQVVLDDGVEFRMKKGGTGR